MATSPASLTARLRRYALVLLDDTVAADDVVRDSLNMLGRQDLQGAENGTLVEAFAVTHRLAMDRLRDGAGRRASASGEARNSLCARRINSRDEQDALSAFSSLNEQERAVLLLASVEQLSYADTANVLGLSMGAMTVLLFGARARFSQAMSGEANLACCPG